MATQNKNECVNVVVRCRPLVDKETKAGHERVVDMDTSIGVVLLKNPKKSAEDPREFTFDFVYDWNSRQAELYDKSFRPLVDAVLEGYNGTIFAYGQTGTGKTYTMEGVRSDPEKRGVIPRSFDHIFSHIEKSENQQYLVRASYLEIYKEEIRDLLSKDQKKRLQLKEHPDTGVYVENLQSFIAKSAREIEQVMTVGNQNRAVGPTDMNEHSSRSHAIFIVAVECSEVNVNGDDHIRVGKLNLVDLAGSERQSKTQTTGNRFDEATKINLSLSALGNVISALANAKSTFVPYRDSRLTFLLRDSLGGNSKTVMVANIGPASYNYEETLVTLRYANRAKNIKNKPRINEDPKDALLREYQNELKRLKEALEKRKKKGGKQHSEKKKKKKHRNKDDGQQLDESSSGEEYSDDEAHNEGDNNEETLKKLQDKLEEERKLIQENTEMVEEEKQSMLKEMHKKVEEVKNERKKLDQMASKIAAMESKLLSGGGAIMITEDQRDLRKKNIQQKRDEMIEMKKRAQDIQKELEERAETNVEVQGSYLSLHDETSSKEKKLKKLQKKLKSVETETEEYKMEQQQMREDLNHQLLDLEKELKLRQMIIEHFIPKSEVDHIQSTVTYNEEKQVWSSTGTTMVAKTTTDDTTSMALDESLPQIIDELTVKHNILLTLDLDMPTRTTCDYQGPQVTPSVQAVIDKAFEDPEDVTIDASMFNDQPSIPTNKGFSSKHNNNSTAFRMKEKIHKTETDPNQQFPTKRGLVKTK